MIAVIAWNNEYDIKNQKQRTLDNKRTKTVTKIDPVHLDHTKTVTELAKKVKNRMQGKKYLSTVL